MSEFNGFNEFDNVNMEEKAPIDNSINEGSENISELSDKKKEKGKRGKATAVFVSAAVILGSFGAGSLATSYTWMQKYEAQQEQQKLTLHQANSEPVVLTGTTTNANGELTIAEIANKASNSVVEISTESVATDSFFGQFVTEGAGSGVIISSEGYIATNNHVIEGASKITVRLKSGEEYEAKLIGTDSQTDVAIIKVEGATLAPVILGNSDNLVVGETAVAIGNPLGKLGGTVSNGIISALDREITLSGQTMTLLQTNAAINPGNSGGGLFNGKGELVGLVVAKSAGSNIEGLGFAIPINKVKEVAESLMQHGYVQGRPALGVMVLNVSSWQTAMQYGLSQMGVYIKGFSEGGYAEEAGLQVGDCIVAIEDTQITSLSDVSSALKSYSVGDEASVTVSRNGKLVTVKVKLAEYKPTTEN